MLRAGGESANMRAIPHEEAALPPSFDLRAYVDHIERDVAGAPRAIARRRFLQAGLALAAANIAFASRPASAQAARFTAYPFTLGVASGSPRTDSVVLWTRLAPEPMTLAGDGGMGAE